MKTLYALTFSLLATVSAFAQITVEGTPLTSNPEALVALTADVPTQRMPYVDVAALEAEDFVRAQDPRKPYRFGYNLDVNLGLNNAGQWQELGKGDRLWRMRVVSPGAITINLQFDQYNLPEGATLFIYNDDRSDVLGALTSQNNKEWGTLGTTLIKGDAIRLNTTSQPACAAKAV